MNKLLLTFLLTLGLTLGTQASDKNTQQLPEATIKKMDRQMTKHKAHTRNFKTHKEFKRMQQRKVAHPSAKRTASKSMHYNTRDYQNGRNYGYTESRRGYYDDYRPIRQRGYSHTKRGWILAYQYDRASFYDNEGFFYGYFNRYGYYFEDVFYRYDRFYTYRDRVRGRGLFNHRYYMPANASYYGFCTANYSDDSGYNRNYERGYNRY